MLKLLVQIMATVLSVGVSFFAAYLIYLFSMKSDAQSKIEKEGYAISGILEKHSSQLFFAYSDVGNKVLMNYLKKNPSATRLDLIDMVLKDLSDLMDHSKKYELDSLFSEYIGDEMPYAGRFYIFALDQYVQALFPPGMKKKGVGYSYPYHYNEKEDQSKWFFPYGPNGIEPWLKEYRRIKSATKMTEMILGLYYNDLIKYEKLNKTKDYLIRNNYQEWILETINDIKTIDVSVRRIESLKKTIELYSLKERLPNLNTIGVFFFLAFLSGLFAPIVIVGFGLFDVENVPINISILVTTILFTFLSGYFLFKDIFPQKETIQSEIAILELRENIDNIKMGLDQGSIVRYDYFNSLIKGVYKDNIPKKYIGSLNKLSGKLSIYNNAILPIIKEFKFEIMNVDMISSCIIQKGQGGNYVGITTILLCNDISVFIHPKMTWVFNIGEEFFSNSEIRLKVPENNKDYTSFISNLNKIKTQLSTQNNNYNDLREVHMLVDSLQLSLKSNL